MTLALCKYVGSKVDLLASSAHLFPVPDHGGKVLVPFVGGGSVAAFYAARGYKVIASDINPRLVNAHIEVQRDAEAVIEVLAVLARTLRSVDREGMADLAGRAFFEEQRDRLSAHFEHGASDAARFLFVIRAGFNGLWRENAAGECTTAYGKPEPNRDLVQADSLRAYSAAVHLFQRVSPRGEALDGFDIEDPQAMAAEQARLERIKRSRPVLALVLPRAPRVSPCEQCGADVLENIHGGNVARFCSDSCRSAAHLATLRAQKKCRLAACGHDAADGKTYCRPHLDAIAARERARRQQRTETRKAA